MLVLPNFVKKIIASLLVFFVLFFSMVPIARADTSWYNPSYQEYIKKVSSGPQDDIFGERYTHAQVWWIIYSLVSFIQNSISGPELGACLSKTDVSEIKSCLDELFPASVLDSLKISNNSTLPREVLASITAPGLVSTASYVEDVKKNFKIIPEANAQTTGFGFGALNPVLTFWRVSRNISYSLFVIAIIALSFMIMFRVKLNPQTAVTIQSAIPKVVIALILVTFSYAIAGLLIDLMYVVIGLVSLMGSQFLGVTNPVFVFNFLTKGFPFPCINVPTGIGLGSACSPTSESLISFQGTTVVGATYFGIIGTFFVYLVAFLVSLTINVFAMLGALGTAGAVVGVGLLIGGSAGVVGLVGIILIVVIAVVALFMIVKILWMLLKAYANIILLTIFAPFQILAGVVIPGAGFGSWLKSFVSNLAVFVITGGLFLFSFIFLLQSIFTLFADFNMGQIISTILVGKVITAAASANQAWPPLLGGGSSMLSVLMLGVSFVLFTIIPKSAQLIEALVKGQPFNYGSAIGESAAPLVALGQFASSKQQGAYRERARLGTNTRADETVNAVLDALGRVGIVKRGS